MYKKAAENLAVLDFCINTHTHTHTHTQFPLYYKITTGRQAVVKNVVSRNLHCGSMLYVCHPDRAKRRKDLCIHSLEMLDFVIRKTKPLYFILRYGQMADAISIQFS